MNLFSVMVLSLVEGVTEFLPISSTGHMIVVSSFLKMVQSENLKAFEVIIQLAAILAIVVIYRDKISFKKLSLWLKVLSAFIPVGLVGFLFAHFIKSLFLVPVVATMFIVGGVAFIILEYFYRRRPAPKVKTMDQISYWQALKVGLWQVLALVPGTSRSGATIFGSMVSGLSRQVAVEFSFLTALPVMLAAAGFDFLKHYPSFGSSYSSLLLFSFALTFIVAFVTVRLFLKYIKKYNLTPFGWYRIIFGIFLLIWFLTK